MQASRYKIQELIDTQGAVSTYQALDTLSNETVLYYQYLAEPISNASHILSDNIPDILNMHYKSGMTHVITVSPTKKQHLKHRLEDSQLEQFLLDTAQALEDASDAGVIHGDIRPERLLFDSPKYLIEGYGVRWEFLPSRYSAPEKKQTVAGDVYSWAKTVGAFVPFSIPRALANLLERCLSTDPKNRPLPEDIVDELSSFYLEISQSPKHPTLISLRQDIADAQPDLLDNLFNKGKSEILTSTQERFVKALDALKEPNPVPKETVVEASVHLEDNTDTTEKLSSADLASSNLKDFSELRASRADVSGVNTDTTSLGEMSSSARLTDAEIANNQSISNENMLLVSSNETIDTTPTDTASTDTASTDTASTTKLDTIDQGLAIIADSGTVATEENPFLIDDDFTDLATRIETPDLVVDLNKDLADDLMNLEIPDLQSADAEIPDIDIPDLQIDALELTGVGSSNTDSLGTEIEFAEIVIEDDFATQERNIDFMDTEITGLDAIEHKPTFHDLDAEQIEIIELKTAQTSKEPSTASSEASSDPGTEFDLTLDVDETILDDLLQDIPQNDINAANPTAASTSSITTDSIAIDKPNTATQNREDLESQAIDNFFPDTLEEVDNGTGFDVSNLDFSGGGFNQKANTSTNKPAEKTTSILANEATRKTTVPSNGFDATVFDTTTFDSKVTAYGTTITEEDTTNTENTLKSKEVISSLIEEVVLEEPKDVQAPSNFPVNDLDFDAFGAGKSVAGIARSSDNFADEEQAHLAALQEALAETQQTAGDFSNLKQTIDNSELMPNSTQLERAFAALSSTVQEDGLAEDNSSTEAQGLHSTHQDLNLTAALSEFTDEESSEQILQSSSTLAEAEEIFDNLPVKEMLEASESIEVKQAIPEASIDLPIDLNLELDSNTGSNTGSNTDFELDLTDTQEDLSLIVTDFSEVNTPIDYLAQDTSGVNSQKPEEDLSILKETHNLIAIEDTNFDFVPDESQLQAEEPNPKNDLSLEAFVADTRPISAPEPASDLSFDSFVDDMDEAAYAYTSEAVTTQPTPLADSNVKATLELLIDDDLELPNQSSVTKESVSIPEQLPELISAQAQQDDLADFLGDVLDNEHNSLKLEDTDSGTDNSTLPHNPKKTLFPIYSGSETLFANETVRLEPDPELNSKFNLELTTEVVSNEANKDTGIFSHTEFEQPLTPPINDDDDDLQVIQLTDFEITPTNDDEIVIPKPSKPVTTKKTDIADARAARAAKRAKRRAEAAEEDIDVFKTAFGKIEQMQASVQEPSSQDTHKTASGSSTEPTIDDGKLTVFEAKHQTIAEKIAAKQAQTLAGSESNKKTKHNQAALKKTVIGRSSRNTILDSDNFGEDNYDAIGKVPAQPIANTAPKTPSKSASKTSGKSASKTPAKSKSAKSATSQPAEALENDPKLTYFEMPSIEEEVSHETPKGKTKKTKRKGLFQKKKPKQKVSKAESLQLDTEFNPNFDTELDTELDFNLDINNMSITAERQAEFNQALGVSPLRTAWRIGAASLVLIGAGAIVVLALPSLRTAQETFVEQSVTRETQNMLGLGLNNEHIVFTQVIPENIQERISIIVVDSPVDSKYPAGHEFHVFPNSPLSLDVKGEWKLQARYQNRTLSNTIPVELPVLGKEPIVFSFNL